MAINGTAKQFEVKWDGEKNAINITTGRPYTPVGGELVVSPNPTAKEARPTSSKIYLNGQEIVCTAYTIGGNNYFKLRDVAKALNFGVTWDGTAKTIAVDTSTGYTE